VHEGRRHSALRAWCPETRLVTALPKVFRQGNADQNLAIEDEYVLNGRLAVADGPRQESFAPQSRLPAGAQIVAARGVPSPGCVDRAHDFSSAPVALVRETPPDTCATSLRGMATGSFVIKPFVLFPFPLFYQLV
jgi:hypothetical protein